MPNPTVYETGSADNVHHLLQKLETFAIANGWTIDLSCLGEDVSDSLNIKLDDSTQSGNILAGNTPWYSNTADDSFSIVDGVITVLDNGTGYYVSMDCVSPGDLVEVEWEIIDQFAGTLYLRLGDNTNNEGASARQVHRKVGTVGIDGFIRFGSDDFVGTFKLIRVTKRHANDIYLSLHKANVGYFHLRSYIDLTTDNIEDPGPRIYLSASNSYVEGSAYNGHPGASPYTTRCNLLDDYYNGGTLHAYYFFATEKHIYIVIEPWQNEFSHMGFGISRKYFDYRGGNFIYGTLWKGDGYRNSMDWARHSLPMGFYHYYWNFNSMRADLVGTPEDKWLNETGYTSGFTIQQKLYGTYNGHTDRMYAENPYYGTSPLSPVYLAGYDHNSYQYGLGEMEEYRRIFCKYIDPKTELAINGEIWKVFPIKRKQLTTPDEYISNSSNYALAYYIGQAA